ncbi:hypothetical protein GOODEAATRI_017339 [Goodea atripinnis]|uniref:Uncharacterized protein n=1 Tax=Goodea atripinnis TaxID=208336 RepID=A0ABV0NMK9_9TELE
MLCVFLRRQVLQGGRRVADDLLGGVNDPLCCSSVRHVAVCEPCRYAGSQHILNGAAVEDVRQLTPQVEPSDDSQKVEMLLDLLHNHCEEGIQELKTGHHFHTFLTDGDGLQVRLPPPDINFRLFGL